MAPEGIDDREQTAGGAAMKHRAYAYIRKDVAGIHLERYEEELRALTSLRLDLARTIVDGPDEKGMEQLFRLISRADADADTTVLLYSLDHIPDTPLDELTEYAHVETFAPRHRWHKHGLQAVSGRCVPLGSRHDVSEETQSVPAVAALRQAVADAEWQFHDGTNEG